MSNITWITPAGSLGTIVEKEYFEFQLDAVDSSGGTLSYAVIAGKLSYGMQVSSTGLLYGIPFIDLTVIAKESFTQTYTIRAFNSNGDLSDRTFSLTLNPVALPQIYPINVSLGTFSDAYYLDIQLTASDPDPIIPPVWILVDGMLPLGTTLTSSGQLYGYILPYDHTVTITQVGWDAAAWDGVDWDSSLASEQSTNYIFTVEVFDGSRYSKTTYSMDVIAATTTTIDSTTITIDSTFITINRSSFHNPFISTIPQALPTERQLDDLAFLVTGMDLDGQTINYSTSPIDPAIKAQLALPAGSRNLIPQLAFLENIPANQITYGLPSGIIINPATGWISGSLGPQLEEQKTYVFGIQCAKVGLPDYMSPTTIFSMTVLGDANNTITWVSPTNLGTIDNGTISDLSIVATSNQINPITYTAVDATTLPPGLTLLSNGLLVGRAAFASFSLDQGTTSFDNQTTNFDNQYTFTVTSTVATNSGFISSQQEFTLIVNTVNHIQYEDLYLKAMPSKEQRLAFLNIINNKEIFPDNMIYRLNDPWFGKVTDMKFLFAAGLTPTTAAGYIANMQNNHFNKSINLGNIKTAIVLDSNVQIKYEVVYLEIVDPTLNNSASPAMSIDRTSQVSGPYTVPPYTTTYINSLDNMKSEVTQIGYSNRGAIPAWMLNPQANGLVLGFTFGMVLAYTLPGKSDLIAYRLKQQNITFNALDFVVDRYQRDSAINNFIMPEDGDIYLKFPKVNVYGGE